MKTACQEKSSHTTLLRGRKECDTVTLPPTWNWGNQFCSPPSVTWKPPSTFFRPWQRDQDSRWSPAAFRQRAPRRFRDRPGAHPLLALGRRARARVHPLPAHVAPHLSLMPRFRIPGGPGIGRLLGFRSRGNVAGFHAGNPIPPFEAVAPEGLPVPPGAPIPKVAFLSALRTLPFPEPLETFETETLPPFPPSPPIPPLLRSPPLKKLGPASATVGNFVKKTPRANGQCVAPLFQQSSPWVPSCPLKGWEARSAKLVITKLTTAHRTMKTFFFGASGFRVG